MTEFKRLNDKGHYEHFVKGEWQTVKQLAIRYHMLVNTISLRDRNGVRGDDLIAPLVKGKLDRNQRSPEHLEKHGAWEVPEAEHQAFQDWKRGEIVSPYDPDEPEDWDPR